MNKLFISTLCFGCATTLAAVEPQSTPAPVAVPSTAITQTVADVKKDAPKVETPVQEQKPVTAQPTVEASKPAADEKSEAEMQKEFEKQIAELEKLFVEEDKKAKEAEKKDHKEDVSEKSK